MEHREAKINPEWRLAAKYSRDDVYDLYKKGKFEKGITL